MSASSFLNKFIVLIVFMFPISSHSKDLAKAHKRLAKIPTVDLVSSSTADANLRVSKRMGRSPASYMGSRTLDGAAPMPTTALSKWNSVASSSPLIKLQE